MPETYTIKISKNTGDITKSTQQNNKSVAGGEPNQREENGSVNFGVVKAMALQYGKQMLQEGTSQYFDYSGNTIMQKQVNEGIGLASDIGTMASSPAGMAAILYKYIMSYINEEKQRNKVNNETKAKNEMLGIIVKDGGRFSGNIY